MRPIMFGDLNLHFTFSPRSPISPCWERKQHIKHRKAQEELGSAGELSSSKGQIISEVKFMLDSGNSLALWLLFEVLFSKFAHSSQEDVKINRLDF